jgi:integrase
VADLPGGVRFHDVRQAAATLMLKKRVPMTIVSKGLGDSDPAVTSRSYALPEIAAEAMEGYAS